MRRRSPFALATAPTRETHPTKLGAARGVHQTAHAVGAPPEVLAHGCGAGSPERLALSTHQQQVRRGLSCSRHGACKRAPRPALAAPHGFGSSAPEFLLRTGNFSGISAPAPGNLCWSSRASASISGPCGRKNGEGAARRGWPRSGGRLFWAIAPLTVPLGSAAILPSRRSVASGRPRRKSTKILEKEAEILISTQKFCVSTFVRLTTAAQAWCITVKKSKADEKCTKRI